MLLSPEPAVVVALPGTGSDSEFARLAFGAACAARDLRILPVQPDRGAIVASCVEALDSAARRYGRVVAAGISLGAAIAVEWGCANPGLAAGVVAALPAWTGGRDGECPAALSARVTAELVRAEGLEATIARMRASSPSWLAETLTRSWRGYGSALPDVLLEAAGYSWPAEARLRSLTVPAVVIGAVDDPVHPFPVAEQWAELIPGAVLHTTTLAEFGADPALLGHLGLGTR
ncbi:alpha/beta fold hydrolase [Nocardia harenae]|uniref:alpha/beta fold hydrolase n=1 Tax=Nocardia harenae TaxID=358707 RepID=UPI00082F1D68|nr:alpha/beta hydrolase [Nocardia harenae]